MAMTSRKATIKGSKKCAQRSTSNVFAMFDQTQIQEFKEAFNMIDRNRDGVIDRDDLREMFASLGKEVTDKYLQDMIEETSAPVTFPVFLSMFGEKLNGTDPEEIIKNAFQCFDPENNGHIHEDRLRELLTTMGDRYTDDEVSELFRYAPIKDNMLNYVEFTRMLKRGTKDDA